MATLLRILIPAGAVVAAYVLLAGGGAPGPAASAPPLVWGVAELGPGRDWGREAFIPDWQAARRIDREAARHFLQHWLPRLRAGEPPPASDPGAGPAGPARLFATDYWTAILPTQAPPAAARKRLNGDAIDRRRAARRSAAGCRRSAPSKTGA